MLLILKKKRELIRASVLFQFTYIPQGKKFDILVIKPRSQATLLAQDIQDLFPQCYSLFMYRDGKAYSISAYRAFSQQPVMYFVNLCRNHSFLRRTIMSPIWGLITQSYKSVKQYYSDDYVCSSHLIILFGLHWLHSLVLYLNERSRGVPIRAIRYEDLIAQPEDICSQVFQYCDIDLSHVKLAIEAMGKDSQEGSTISQGQLSTYKMSADEEKQLLSSLQMHPTIKTTDYILPGTFTPTKY